MQLRCTGDDFPFGFANGHSMRNTKNLNDFKYSNQKVIEKDGVKTIITVLEVKDGRGAKHYLTHKEDQKAVRVWELMFL